MIYVIIQIALLAVQVFIYLKVKPTDILRIKKSMLYIGISIGLLLSAIFIHVNRKTVVENNTNTVYKETNL